MTQSEIIEQKNALNSEKLTLESQLSSSDYRVIKCAEAQAVGGPLPYDAAKLHADRQAKRDRINEIEEEINRLDALEPEDESPTPEDENNGGGGIE